MGVLIVGTRREAEADLAPAAREALGVLARDGRTLPLRGLTEDEVTRLLAGAMGGEEVPPGWPPRSTPPPGATVLRRRAGPAVAGRGAPAAGALPDPLPVPEGVRGAVRRRVAGLGAETQDALAVAAVIGREFDVEVLARVCGASVPDTTDRLAPAGAASIMLAADARCSPGTRSPTCSSARCSTRTSRRVAGSQLHARIGETLEDLPPARRRPAEVAHHFLAALPAGDAAKAAAWAAAAGDQAAQLLAHEEAAAHYERALRALELVEPGDERRRADLLVALGEARNWSGDTPKARDAFRSAAARRPRRAAARATRPGRARLWPDRRQGGIRRRAARRAPARGARRAAGADSSLRVRLLGRLARELHFAPDPEEREALSAEAVAMARRLGDAATLAFALGARHVATWAPETLPERLAAAEEIVRLAAAAGDRRLLFDAHVWQASDLVETGDVGGADTAMRACRDLRQTSTLRRGRGRSRSTTGRAP